MSREQCQYCGKPLANYKDFDDIEDGEGEHLCWARFDRCLVGPEGELDRIKIDMKRLEYHSAMLGDIASIVRRYCRTPETTTLQAVQAMDARIKKLNARIRNLQKIDKW